MLALVGLFAVWLLMGFVRGPSAAAWAMAEFEAPRTSTTLATTTLPAIPPFFIVQVQATVTEPGGAHYESAQFFLVEPFTGWAVDLSALGLAPSS